MALDAPKQTSGAAPRTNTAARRCGRRAEARQGSNGQGWHCSREAGAAAGGGRRPERRQGCTGQGWPCSREISVPGT
jgi:hypothetical protein